MSKLRGPLLARLVARLVLPRDMWADILGDMHESYTRRRQERGRSSAWLWYWRQVAGFVARYPAARWQDSRPKRRRDRHSVVSGRAFIRTLAHDTWYSCRSLARSRDFTVVVVLMLGVAIGATTAIISAFNALVFRGLPVPNPQEIVALGSEHPTFGRFPTLSYPNFLDYRGQETVLKGAAVQRATTMNLAADGSGDRVQVDLVSPNFFEFFGVQATLGRFFTADQVGAAGSEPLVVLEHGYWQRRFAGDPSIIGRSVLLNGHPVTIVGVAPEGFTGGWFLTEVIGWLPITSAGQVEPRSTMLMQRRACFCFVGFARLQERISAAEAELALDAFAAELEVEYPDDNRELRVAVVPEPRARFGMGSQGEWLVRLAAIFVALVALVLVSALGSVTNLTLTRLSGRTHEIAMRLALGAGRHRIGRQLLAESLILSILAGLVGLLVAAWATLGLTAVVGQWRWGNTFRFDLTPDGPVALVGLALALVCGGIMSAPPIVRALEVGPARSGAAGRGATRGRRAVTTNSVLVAGQIALSVVLLVGSATFLGSLWRGQEAPLGFVPDNLLLVSVDPDLLGYDRERGRQFYAELSEQVGALPGVEAAAMASFVPFGNRMNTWMWAAEGQPTDGPEDFTPGIVNSVSPGYFRAAGTRIVKGRGFTDSDPPDVPIAIVNEHMAELMWPGEDPVGKRLTIQGTAADLFIRVVGVAEDGKYMQIWEEPRSVVYLPIAIQYASPMTLFVRTASAPLELAAPIRHASETLDSDMPLFQISSMNEHLRDSAFIELRLGAVLAFAFGILGAGLATLGLYSVMTYSVRQQTREFGIRVALGASTRQVVWFVAGRALLLVAAGLASGALAATLLAPTATSFVVGATAAGPRTIFGVVLLVLATAMLASLPPAWRASQVDPVVSLADD